MNNQNLRGALIIIVSCAFFAATGVIAKMLGSATPTGESAGTLLHPLQISFGRFFFAFLTLIPFVLYMRPSFKGSNWALHFGRSFTGWSGVSAMFAAVTLMPLAEATAISFLNPIFTMVLAILFLGEKVGPWRWGAAGVSFFGVIVLTQPGTDAFQPAALIAMLAAVMMGAELIFIKRLTGTEPLLRILFINNGMGAIISGVAMLFFWTPPDAFQLALMASIGVIMVSGQVLFLNGMRMGEANFIAPFIYTTLLYATLYGAILFDEIPDLLSSIGGILIVAGALILGWRERLAASRMN